MASSSVCVEATPPWAELPRDITAEILYRLGPVEILTSAQNVCKYWRSVCQDPAMWRCIDIKRPQHSKTPFNFEGIFREVVNRSQGQLTDISTERLQSDDLLLYLSRRSGLLRRLELSLPHPLSDNALTEAVKNFLLLEELHLHWTNFDAKTIETVGRSCPLLQSFALNQSWGAVSAQTAGMEARAVAENMPNLRHLQLIGNKVTTEGLVAILDGCPHLESLDLRHCFNVYFDESVERLCSGRIKELRRPEDSLDDYNYAGITLNSMMRFENVVELDNTLCSLYGI